MSDESILQPAEAMGEETARPPEACESAQDRAVFGRFFASAVELAGSPSALGRHLGLTESELQPYLTGESMPPAKVILRTVEWVIETRRQGLLRR